MMTSYAKLTDSVLKLLALKLQPTIQRQTVAFNDICDARDEVKLAEHLSRNICQGLNALIAECVEDLRKDGLKFDTRGVVGVVSLLHGPDSGKDWLFAARLWKHGKDQGALHSWTFGYPLDVEIDKEAVLDEAWESCPCPNKLSEMLLDGYLNKLLTK